jgi:hypothetical protein
MKLVSPVKKIYCKYIQFLYPYIVLKNYKNEQLYRFEWNLYKLCRMYLSIWISDFEKGLI